MTSPKDAPTHASIEWRGLKFEYQSSDSRWEHYAAGSPISWTLRHLAGIVDAWDVRDGDEEIGEGGTAEEALESARSQVEAIARAVGLIPNNSPIDAIRTEMLAIVERRGWDGEGFADLSRFLEKLAAASAPSPHPVMTSSPTDEEARAALHTLSRERFASSPDDPGYHAWCRAYDVIVAKIGAKP